jgi:hypothetical protein
VNIYILTGFRSPGFGVTGFLIPYFTLENSNLVFAQELDTSFKIRSFVSFNPEHYEPVRKIPPPVPREVGQQGLLAYNATPDRVVFGDIKKLKRAIAKESLSIDTQAFFNLEASLLLGDHDRIANAIWLAGQKFTVSSAQSAWASVETAIQEVDRKNLVIGWKLRLSSESNYRDLENLENPEWAHEWVVRWRRSKDRRALLKLALQWLQFVSLTADDVPSIIEWALRSYPQEPQLRDYAIRWLDLEEFNSVCWAPIWMALSSKTLPQYGNPIAFLGATARLADFRSVSNWRRVWVRLRSNDDNQAALVELGEQVIADIINVPELFETVIPYLMKIGSVRPSTEMEIRRWLQSGEKGRNIWPESFLWCLRRRPDDQALIDLGLHWLSFYTNLNRWKDVWDALRAVNIKSELMIKLARNWLERAYPKIRIWPEIMMAVLESGPPRVDEIKRAAQWLDSHSDRSDTEPYKKLSSIIKRPPPR